MTVVKLHLHRAVKICIYTRNSVLKKSKQSDLDQIIIEIYIEKSEFCFKSTKSLKF